MLVRIACHVYANSSLQDPLLEISQLSEIGQLFQCRPFRLGPLTNPFFFVCIGRNPASYRKQYITSCPELVDLRE